MLLKPYKKRPDFEALALKAQEKASIAEKAFTEKSYHLCFMYKHIPSKKLLEPELSEMLKAQHGLCVALHRAALSKGATKASALEDLCKGVLLEGFILDKESVRIHFKTGGK